MPPYCEWGSAPDIGKTLKSPLQIQDDTRYSWEQIG